ncbi:hypothetical protein QLX08_011511 [Tetragonisca angustula]|uniref:Ig-like domain-containing protein n=1 Tax=Tetragonisca angustula TaxID=166442 RepID=A0AAW0Z850_9HYME
MIAKRSPRHGTRTRLNQLLSGNISDSQYITYMTSPPTILVRPQSQQVKAGGIASFYCTAEGAPPPQIHWRKNGKRVSQSQSRYLVHNYENGALLRIEPVRPIRDNTLYECLAENGVGDAVSAEAQLRVYEGGIPESSCSTSLDKMSNLRNVIFGHFQIFETCEKTWEITPKSMYVCVNMRRTKKAYREGIREREDPKRVSRHQIEKK